MNKENKHESNVDETIERTGAVPCRAVFHLEHVFSALVHFLFNLFGTLFALFVWKEKKNLEKFKCFLFELQTQIVILM